MNENSETARVLVRPPIAWAVAVIAGFALDWLEPLPLVPDDLPAGLVGAVGFMLALALAIWAMDTMTRAGTNVPTNRPTTAMVESGPYRFTRNPIYLGMFGGLVGLAIAFDTPWPLVTLVPFALRHPLRRRRPRGRPISSASSARLIATTERRVRRWL